MLISIVYQLAVVRHGVREALMGVLLRMTPGEIKARVNGDDGSSVEMLFRQMLLKPAKAGLKAVARPVVIVVDGLDELQPGSDRTDVLQLIGRQMAQLPEKVRFVLTARLEADIMHELQSHRMTVKHLHETELAKLQEKDATRKGSENICAPGVTDRKPALTRVVNQLFTASGGSFLWARLAEVTLQQLAGKRRLDETEALRAVSGLGLDGLHTQIFEHMWTTASAVSTGSSADGKTTEKAAAAPLIRVPDRLEDLSTTGADTHNVLVNMMWRILAVLVALKEPLHAMHLEDLLLGAAATAATRSVVQQCLRLLPTTILTQGLVTPLHQSTFEWLKDQRQSGAYWVDEAAGHAILARDGMQMLAAQRQTQDRVSQPDQTYQLQPRSAVPFPAPLLGYAARYAVQHALAMGKADADRFLHIAAKIFTGWAAPRPASHAHDVPDVAVPADATKRSLRKQFLAENTLVPSETAIGWLELLVTVHAKPVERLLNDIEAARGGGGATHGGLEPNMRIARDMFALMRVAPQVFSKPHINWRSQALLFCDVPVLGPLSAWYDPTKCRPMPAIVRQPTGIIVTGTHVRSIAAHPTEPLLAVACEGSIVLQLFDVRRGALRQELMVCSSQDAEGQTLQFSRWSPDGSKLAVVIGSNAASAVDPRLFVFRTTNWAQIVSTPVGSSCAHRNMGWSSDAVASPWCDWSPDSRMLAADGLCGLMLIECRGKRVQEHVLGEMRDTVWWAAGQGAGDIETRGFPSWSPCGRYISISMYLPDSVYCNVFDVSQWLKAKR